jgi:regulator of protease activity HflC (stomatin/prohibitin superfamily)
MTTAAGDSQQRPWRYGSSFVSLAVGVVLTVGLVVLLLWQAVLIRIPPGHVGVIYRLFGGGTDMAMVHPEGLVAKQPWNTLYIVETRLQALNFNLLAYSAEGMQVGVEATVLYQVKKPEAGKLVAEVGLDYAERVIRPLSTAAVRRIIARYSSHELYTVGADRLQAELLESLRAMPEARFFHYMEIPLRSLKLSDRLTAAIEIKLAEEQRAASYGYILESQRQETERLRIQAIGLRNFHSVIQDALTDRLLTWRGIEATVELSKSPNTKVVIVGGNKDQLPLILGSDITRSPADAGPPLPPVAGDAAPLPDFSKLPPIFPPPTKSP